MPVEILNHTNFIVMEQPTKTTIQTATAVDAYRGHFIKPKLDFGSGKGFLINGEWVKTGFVVTDGMCNVMPGACWFTTVEQAQKGIDCLIAANGNAAKFWANYHGHKTTVQIEVKYPTGKLSALAAMLETWNLPTRAEVASRVRDKGFVAYVGGHHVGIYEFSDVASTHAGERLAIVTSTAPDFN